jgi:hypothetical protein
MLVVRDNKDRDAEGRGKRKTTALPVGQFLARLLEHVPPPGLQTVRSYGLYSNSKRAERALAREHFAPDPERLPPKVTWRELCVRAGRTQGTVCPVCGAPLVVHRRWSRLFALNATSPPPARNAGSESLRIAENTRCRVEAPRDPNWPCDCSVAHARAGIAVRLLLPQGASADGRLPEFT